MDDTVKQFINEFAELNLNITKQLKELNCQSIDPELIRELRENAQVLVLLITRV